LGGSESLTVDEAEELAGDHGVTVVVIAGERDSGKTTLVTELWARFLRAPFGGWLFGGSRTLLAFDVRHRGARESSGGSHARTPRTQEEDFRLMHLRICNKQSREKTTLLLSDAKGELYEHIIDGTAVTEELSSTARADFLMLLVDGASVGDPFKRATAIHRGRMLLGGLLDPDGYRPPRPVAIVLSRADLADAAATRWWREEVADLQQVAEERGHPTTIIELAARPDASPDTPEGLDHVLSWLTTPSEVVPASMVPVWGDEARGAWRYQSKVTR
jgi:Double-GTPase 2